MKNLGRRMWLAVVVFVVASVIAVTGCGTVRTVAARPIEPPSGSGVFVERGCPVPAPMTSSGGPPDALAPGHPTKTRFCVYKSGGGDVLSDRVYSGGPLDRALNGSLARYPPRTACAGTAMLPTVIVLIYANKSARHIAVDIGGCRLITSHHTNRALSRGVGILLAYYTKNSRR